MTGEVEAHSLTLTTDAATGLAAVVVRDAAGSIIAEHVLEDAEIIAVAEGLWEAVARRGGDQPTPIDAYAILREVLARREAGGTG